MMGKKCTARALRHWPRVFKFGLRPGSYQAQFASDIRVARCPAHSDPEIQHKKPQSPSLIRVRVHATVTGTARTRTPVYYGSSLSCLQPVTPRRCTLPTQPQPEGHRKPYSVVLLGRGFGPSICDPQSSSSPKAALKSLALSLFKFTCPCP
eukprot:3078575-Rhodomonas_salina.2